MTDVSEDTMPRGSMGRSANFLRSIPPSRWLLFAGSLGALLLAFVPWLSGSGCVIHHSNGCALYSNFTVRPFATFIELQMRLHPTFMYFIAFTPYLVLACMAPGVLCSIWVHGPIRSTGQRVGVVVFSVWFLLLTVASIAIPEWAIERSITLGREADVTWGPDIGIFLVAPVLIALWIGLLLTWRDLLQRRGERDASAIQRLHTWEYVGAGLVTGGLVLWFVAYYGLYWLLPPDCPATPLFGEAACNERFGSGEGFDRLFLSPGGHDVSWIVYGTLSAVIVFGGLALLVALWLRRTSSKDLIGIGIWMMCLLLLTGLSIYGTTRIVPYSGDDVWTSGVWLTLFGIALIAGGLVMRWRQIRPSQARDVL